MDTFKKFLIFVIFQISYGRKLYTYEPYWVSSHSTGEPKSVEEKIYNVNPEKVKNDESLQKNHMFKTNDVYKKFRQKLSQNENHPSMLNSDYSETLETEVGEHLIKVTSKKDSKDLSYAPRGGGYDISINPKYSHIIEIIHRGDNKQNKPAVTYVTTVQNELKIRDSEKNIETNLGESLKFSGETNKGYSEEFEADDDNTKESDKTKGESEEFEDYEENPMESEKTGGELEDFHEEDTEESGKIKGESEDFSKVDEEDFEESGGTERETQGICKSDLEKCDETEDTREINGFDVEDPEECNEIDEDANKLCDFKEDPEECVETEDTKEFEFEEDPEEFDAIEKDTEEFDDDYEENSDESDEKDADKFDNDIKEVPENSEELEEDTEEFDDDYEANSDESDENEKDADIFDNDIEEVLENSEELEEDLKTYEIDESDTDFVDANENNAEKTDERGPEVFEADEGNIVESTEIDETDRDQILPGGIEDAKTFEEANNMKNGMDNEQISNNKSSFNEEFEASGEEFVGTTDRNTTKTGRILGILSRQNETFPTCTTQRGEAGHCRRLGECLLSEALSNFNGFLQQLCLIRGALVGICCPDNPVIETVNPDDNTTNQLTAEEIEQPPEGCGLNTKTRIVGGSISVPHEWTWMVALMRRNRFYCGGVIINNWYILTAAHCVMGMNVKDLTVRLGEYDFNEQSKHTEDLSVSEIKRHAQFVTLTFQHDIALLKLKRSIKYSKFVGSICLPEQKARDYSDAKGTVVGWGTVSFGGAASPVLRQVTVPVWKNEDCDRTYLLESIGDSFMCAGAPEKGEDACQGDSGGPLMTINEKGRWEVIGLVSWGRRCGDPTYPGVYTRVTTYLDWIKQNAV